METDHKRRFTAIWEEYQPMVERFCRIKLNGYPADIDDIVENVFFALWCKLISDELPENLIGWLYGTAKNMLNRAYREKKETTKNTVPFDEEEAQFGYFPDFIFDIETAEIEDELEAEVKSALSDEEKRLMELIHREGKTLTEAAEEFNISYDAIKQKNYRTVGKIRKIAKKYFY